MVIGIVHFVGIGGLFLIGAFAYLFKDEFKSKKNSHKTNAHSYFDGATLIDLVDNKSITVINGIEKADDKTYVNCINGKQYTYDDNLFKVLNLEQVLVGKRAIITYGLPKDVKDVEKILKSKEVVEQELAITKAIGREAETKLLKNMGDILKGSKRSQRDQE